MKVIGAGLPRTATLSQKIALEMLGLGPCYHMVNVLADLEEVPRWRAAVGGDADWEQIFDGFQSTVDWPGSFFYEQLLEVYPEAKVLLSVRDSDAWERSMRQTIWGVFYGDSLTRHLSSARARVDPRWNSYLEMMTEMWGRSGLMPGGEATDAASMRTAMEKYHEQVKASVAPDRLLVWTASDGWEPLCAFLEVDVPDAPFPRANDAKMFNERLIDGSLSVLQQWWTEQQPAVASA
jgi:Sulfotransferase domain